MFILFVYNIKLWRKFMSNSIKKLKNIAIYCGSYMPKDKIYIEAALELIDYMSCNDMTLIYGGSNVGVMKVIADRMLERHGRVIGIFTHDLPQEILHPNLTSTVIVDSLAQRKAEMLRLSDAVIALPGSFGTWDELFDALALCKINSPEYHNPVGILNVNGYYDPLLKLIESSIEVGFTAEQHRSLLKCANNASALFSQLAQ